MQTMFHSVHTSVLFGVVCVYIIIVFCFWGAAGDSKAHSFDRQVPKWRTENPVCCGNVRL
jgi:hypothetical protein